MEPHPVIVAGFGFRAEAGIDSLMEAAKLAGTRPDAVATLEDKATSPVFAAFARALQVPVIAVTDKTAQDQVTLTVSQPSLTARGTGSVAEAVALAAAGHGARLLAPRVISTDKMATCALAQKEDP